jgi:fucose 4-O-acetylase-like acetyltransferase
MDLFFNSQKILGNTRYAWIDYAKGICIILVTFRHVQEGLHPAGTEYLYPGLKFADVFFFSFRMPLFFIVSGIFLGGALERKSVSGYIGSRFKTIVYPLLVWGTIQVTLQLLFKGYVNVDRQPIDYLNLIIKPREIEQFWYLHTLFLTGSFYAIMKVHAKFKIIHQLMLGVLLYAVTGYFRYNNLYEHLFIFDVFFYYIFFAVGDMFGKFVLDQKNFKVISARRTFLLFTPVFLILELYFTNLNISNKWDYYVQNQMPALFIFVGMVGGAYLIHCSFLLQKLDVLKFIRVIGYHSLHIYVIHLAVTAGTRIFFREVLHYDNFVVLLIISTILGIGVPIIFYNITDRLGMWWLFTLKNPNTDKKHLQPVWKTHPGKIAPEEPVQKINPQVIEKN